MALCVLRLRVAINNDSPWAIFSPAVSHVLLTPEWGDANLLDTHKQGGKAYSWAAGGWHAERCRRHGRNAIG